MVKNNKNAPNKRLTKAQREMREMARISSIEDHLIAVYHVHCSQCSQTGFHPDDPWDYAERLYKDGWRWTAGNMYCPTCVQTIQYPSQLLHSQPADPQQEQK